MSQTPTAHLYLVHAQCWKCRKPVKVAMIKGAAPHHFYGPEGFNPQLTELAQQHGASIQPQYSHTQQTTYPANTCAHCQAFIGEHYLFTEYFMSAIEGSYVYEKLGVESLAMSR